MHAYPVGYMFKYIFWFDFISIYTLRAVDAMANLRICAG